MQRRTLLSGLSAVGAIAIAGCSSPDGGDQTGPEEAAEQYITAFRNGNAEGMNDVLHPNSPSYPRESTTPPENNITVNNITRVSPRELVEQRAKDANVTDEQIQRGINNAKQTLENKVDESGGEKGAIVQLSIEQGELPTKPIYIMVKDDGKWYVYQVL